LSLNVTLQSDGCLIDLCIQQLIMMARVLVVKKLNGTMGRMF